MRTRTRLTTGALATVFAAAGASLLPSCAMVELPAVIDTAWASTAASVGVHDVGLRVVDDKGPGRRLSIWYPASAPGQQATVYDQTVQVVAALGPLTVGRFEGRAVEDASPSRVSRRRPLVVLSPGFALGASAYAWLAERLASHGFVVVAADEPDEAVGDAMGELWRALVRRPLRLKALLAEPSAALLGDDVARLADTDRVIVIGHSLGGHAAQAAAGARVAPASFARRCEGISSADDDGAFLCEALLAQLPDMAAAAGVDGGAAARWSDWSSPTVVAAVSLAGDAYLYGAEGLASLEVPVLAIGGTADRDTPLSWGTDETFAHAGSSLKRRVHLEGAGHGVFMNRCTSVLRLLGPTAFDLCEDEDGRRLGRQEAIVGAILEFMATISRD